MNLDGPRDVIEEHEARLVRPVERPRVHEDRRAEAADHASVRVTADDDRVASGEHRLQIGVDLERVALVVREQARHIVEPQAVAEEHRADLANRGQRREVGVGRGRRHERRVGEVSHLVREEPAVVVTADGEHATRGEELAAAIEIAPAVREIADGEDRIHIRERVERDREELVLCVDVADQAVAHGGSVARMAKVLGIGGVFVKAKDPTALCAWYRDMLGMEIAEWGGAQLWNEGKTYAVWTPFKADSSYFEGSFMINLRVDDAEALAADLRAKGANVLDRGEDTDDGKFRYVVDPDGTLLELFQPAT